MLREKEGGLSSPTQNLSFNSVNTAQMTVFSSFSVKGGMAAGMGLSKAPDTKFLILGFQVPAGSERGAEDVYSLLPPAPDPELVSRLIAAKICTVLYIGGGRRLKGWPSSAARLGWLEESDPEGCDFVSDERSIPLSLTDCTICKCPGLGLI
jgi:hypothetical protein